MVAAASLGVWEICQALGTDSQGHKIQLSRVRMGVTVRREHALSSVGGYTSNPARDEGERDWPVSIAGEEIHTSKDDG